MRFKLTIRFAGKLLDTYEFDKDQVSIGRAPDCDVIIDNLGVSRVHAQIERSSDVFVLRDLKSNNGTFVRGERVQRYNLNHMDEFFVGKHSITFMYSEPSENSDAPTSSLPSNWLDEATQPEQPTPIAPSKKEEPRNLQEMTMSMDAQDIALIGVKKNAAPAAYLTITNASGIRQQIVINKTAIFFGLSPKCDYQIEGWFISKRHVILLREDTGFRLIHLGPKKPPKINGVEIDDQKLKHGDVLDIENLRLVFNMGSP